MKDNEKLDLILEKLNYHDKQFDNIENKINQNQNELQEFRSEANERFDKIEERLYATFEQTANLTEFRTKIMKEIKEINENIDYLTTKEAVNEREIHKIKNKI